MKIALILTAGALKSIYDDKGKYPFWMHWPLFKGEIKKLEKEGLVDVVHEERLKSETVARLQKALSLNVDLFSCVGGHSPQRKEQGLKDSVELMNNWLLKKGVRNNVIMSGDSSSVDTGSNISEFFERLKSLEESSEEVTIYLVTSWYHIFRANFELKNALKKLSISATIINTPVFPDFDIETLKYEYLWNLMSEPFKILILLFPKLKIWLRKVERENRK